ncbi:MAG: adenylate/guanylate cyclase domain-containing protein [Arenicellales bacterium]|nr:adenylate/guanylate cyclase domain-containing protein [Arenicellales bacterium]
MQERLPRKLAAILYADVAGYSRMTGQDEDATHRSLRQRLDQLAETIESNGGFIVHYAGDAVLARFDAALDAVSAAIKAQELFNLTAMGENGGNEITFRMGINLGDVIEDQGDIYGDGVNIAARLETLADPGGVCISESVRTALGNKLPVDFESIGSQQVKNIAEPITAYRLLIGGAAKTIKAVNGASQTDRKPSILVVPFVSRTHDPEDGYLVDGITEEIRLGLCRFKGIMVIARGSSNKVMEQSMDSVGAAKQLNADYLLEGSVQKGGSKIRVSASLTKTSTGQQVWAERYDRTLENLFEIQDEVSQRIITKLIGSIEEESKDSALRKGTDNLTAYDCVLRGNHYFGDWRGSRENMELAAEMYQRAIDLDPQYAAAYAGLASVRFRCFEKGWTDAPEETGEASFRLARKAVELDPHDSLARLVLAVASFKVRQNVELTHTQIQAALELNPNQFWNYCFKCWFSTCVGDFEEGIHCGIEAIQRNPLLPDGCLYSIGFAEYLAGRYEKAIEAYGRMSHPYPEDEACIAACYAQLGRLDEAKEAGKEFRRRIASEDPDKDPGSDPQKWKDYWLELFPLKDQAALDHVIDGLIKAGLIT